LQFRGFPDFRSNVLYCPKQLFTVVIPNSSVNCIRLVSYMLRKTLGWVNEAGDPIQEQHAFGYRDLEGDGGIVHSGLQKAITEALDRKFIGCVQTARMQVQGVRARSASYELLWNESSYTDDIDKFAGFHLQASYIDQDGQTRIGRKNIPNVFFDYLVKNESRRVIRVVGTLLWYSIDWGKGGERKQPVKKSLWDLVELTQLDKSNVVRALDEAQEKGYVERLERGVFDLSGRKESSTTVYGIHWTDEYTYTHEGLPVGVSSNEERTKKATQPVLVNAPKRRHEAETGTLQKSDTGLAGERSKKATQNAPETQHSERSKKATYVIINKEITNTPINNSSDSPAPEPLVAAVAEEALLKVGFDRKAARQLSSQYPAESILKQIEALPLRRPSNPLGMLRHAITVDLPLPALPAKTTDVGSSHGRTFAAHFYAGYHGNSEAPVSDPSAGDSEAGERFVQRLLQVSPEPASVDDWGRSFGELVAHQHGQNRQSFPALRLAIQRYGDDFYSRFKTSCEAHKRRAIQLAQEERYEKYQGEYEKYLRAELGRHEVMNSTLFQKLVLEEMEKLKELRSNRFGLVHVERLCEQFLAGRFERFQRLVVLETDHDVLDFWEWDKTRSVEEFGEASL
jgi:hypothetical protein